MRRFLTIVLTSFLMVLPAFADEPTLTFTSKEAYENSLVEVAKEIGEDQASLFMLSIVSLALGGQPYYAKGQPSPDDFDIFLERMRPYEGFTAAQILEADNN